MMNKALVCAVAGLGILAGSDLTFADDAAPSAATPAPTTLERVIVQGARIDDENYRVKTVDSLGPLGTTPILDTPYTMEVLPLDLIQNSQATNFKDVSKYLPLVAYQEQQGPDVLRPQTRGMQGSNFQNTKMDGMTMFMTGATAMEQFQQIEVVSGPTSFLYGPANPSGMFNFVSKRPTDQDLHEVSASYNSDSIGTAKLDFGGKIDSGGIFSYRLNGLFGEGDAFVPHSHQRRELGDIGLDIRPFDHAVLELNYSDYTLVDKGYPGWFAYGQKINLPPAPDPQRVGYGQPYAGVDLRTRIATARIKYELNANWHMVAGILNQDVTRTINTPVNNLTSNTGTYVSSLANGFAPRFVITSDTAYLNGNFATWGLGHDLTFGTSGYRASSYAVNTAASAASVLLGTASISAPQLFPEPVGGPPNVLANHDSSDNYQQGFNLGDTLTFDQHWSARAGVSQDWFHTNNFNAASAATTRYSSHGLSPTGSIIFKPLDDMTSYVTYASSLAAGDLAPGTAANAGTSLPPYRSKEYEAGYKVNLTGINLTAALFRIERPFASINPVGNIFEITGLQVNKGVELTAVGTVVHGLTVYGGLTLLDARMEHTLLPSTNGQTYVGAPKIKGNVLFEYSFAAVSGLVASLDYQFSGPRAANDTNSLTAAGYNLIDLGVRYASQIAGKPVTWRVGIDNITDRNYWSTIGPSNLTGANTGNLLAHLGSPRTVQASVTVDL